MSKEPWYEKDRECPKCKERYARFSNYFYCPQCGTSLVPYHKVSERKSIVAKINNLKDIIIEECNKINPQLLEMQTGNDEIKKYICPRKVQIVTEKTQEDGTKCYNYKVDENKTEENLINVAEIIYKLKDDIISSGAKFKLHLVNYKSVCLGIYYECPSLEYVDGYYGRSHDRDGWVVDEYYLISLGYLPLSKADVLFKIVDEKTLNDFYKKYLDEQKQYYDSIKNFEKQAKKYTPIIKRVEKVMEQQYGKID